jgi:hypothetical protein
MRSKPFTLILCAILCATLASAGCGPTEQDESQAPRASRPPSGFTVGGPFPELSLPGLDGGSGSIADFRGKKVILHVFASW